MGIHVKIGDQYYKALPIAEFINEYGINYTVEGIGYNLNKLDWVQPARDRFIILTDKTKDFFGINE